MDGRKKFARRTTHNDSFCTLGAASFLETLSPKAVLVKPQAMLDSAAVRLRFHHGQRGVA
jgi:hypothetical protein